MKYLFYFPKVVKDTIQTHQFKMESFNNISLYIKRADLYQTKEYIINVFASNNIGIVKEVKFIEKTDGFSRAYNGAIVIFERWFMNAKVRQLLDEMGTSMDGTTKFTYDYHGHFWFINVHKPVVPESETIPAVDPSLPDKQRIDELEKLVQSMAAQMHYNQLRQERTERQLMEVEEKQSHQALCNMELRFQLEDKDMVIEWARKENEKVLKEAQDEVVILKSRLACMAIDLVRKDEEIRKLSYSPNVSEMCLEELV